MKMKMDIFRKTCALVAVSLMLPALAYASKGGNEDTKGKGDSHGQGDNKGKGNGDDKSHGHKPPPVVPEANAGWVLLPFFGAVLLFSWRQLSRAKA
jgi:hypothetical protein